MNLTPDEQKLITEFRRLPGEVQQELLDYAAFLQKKQNSTAEERAKTCNQCPAPHHPEERPEAKKEPIFTE